MGLREIRELKAKADEPKKPKYGLLNKKSEKKIQKEKEDQSILDRDMEFYLSLWVKRPKVCYECGCFLGYKFKKWFAHHIIAKSKFESFRYDERNLVFLCLQHHDQAGIDLSKVPKTLKLTEETKKLLLNE